MSIAVAELYYKKKRTDDGEKSNFLFMKMTSTCSNGACTSHWPARLPSTIQYLLSLSSPVNNPVFLCINVNCLCESWWNFESKISKAKRTAEFCSFCSTYPIAIHIMMNPYKEVVFSGTGNPQFCGYRWQAAIRPTFVLRETVDNCMLFAKEKSAEELYPHIHSSNNSSFSFK